MTFVFLLVTGSSRAYWMDIRESRCNTGQKGGMFSISALCVTAL